MPESANSPEIQFLRAKSQKPGGSPAPNKGAENRQLIDTFARTISYLRLSLTDQCNLRCLYCTPKKAQEKLASSDLLTYEEILKVTSLAVEMGIRKVRLTGGEPLVRRDILSFIRRLAAIERLRDIRLTTNGVLLPQMAGELYEAGIRKLNISLDTLQPSRYREITRADHFDQVWKGIQYAKEAGFTSIKLNVVALRGFNEDELLDFGRLTFTEPFQIRFIEFMPVGTGSLWSRDRYLSSQAIMTTLSALAPLVPLKTDRTEGPAMVYRYKGAVGTLGFISPISNHFCDKCNRLRLTSEGRLRSCLFSDEEIDLRAVLRSGGTEREIKQALQEATLTKPKGHLLAEKGFKNCHGQMSRIGG